MLFRASLYFTLLLHLCQAQIQLIPKGAVFDNHPSSACLKALGATISCSNLFTYYPNYDYQAFPNNSTALDQFCSSNCSTSLASHHRAISVACRDDLDIYDGVPAIYGVERLWAYQNRTCLKDSSTGSYCNGLIAKWSSSLPDEDIALDQIPKEHLCSECYMSLLQTIQSSPYSSYDESMVEPYKRAQTICGVSYPTEIQEWPVNATQYIPPGLGEVMGASEADCASGKFVKVKAGDDCRKISAANSVSTGSLRVINALFPDCSNIVAGASLCLPQNCSTYTVKPNDTCVSISRTSPLSVLAITSFNPTINGACSNLVAGETICVSPPAGLYTPSAISSLAPTISGAFANKTAAPPGPTASGTTRDCGRWYKVTKGDTCQKISMSQAIAVTLLKQLNPSLNNDCSNLLSGIYYCILPTSNWNGNSTSSQTNTTQHLSKLSSTASYSSRSVTTSISELSSVTVASSPPASSPPTSADASTSPGSTSPGSVTNSPSNIVSTATPTPTRTGMATGCSNFYKAVSGDICTTIAQKFAIGVEDFEAWNPAVGMDCGNLWINYWYCIAR